jgi:hypothetical protein
MEWFIMAAAVLVVYRALRRHVQAGTAPDEAIGPAVGSHVDRFAVHHHAPIVCVRKDGADAIIEIDRPNAPVWVRMVDVAHTTITDGDNVAGGHVEQFAARSVGVYARLQAPGGRLHHVRCRSLRFDGPDER